MAIEMYKGWRTRSDGSIEVTKEDMSSFVPILTSPIDVARCESGIARWADQFRIWGQGVRWEWLIAMAYQESAFNPRARNKEGTEDTGNDGIGLFQLTYPTLKGRKLVNGKWEGGYTDEQLFDPQLNTTIASRYILDLMKRYGNNFPKVSAAFNAGSVRPSLLNPWGMHCTGAHIAIEVAALNYVVLRGSETPCLIDLTQLAREADDDAREAEATIVVDVWDGSDDNTPTVPK